jgi:hypothetical protein
MNTINYSYLCPVCGYNLGFKAWYSANGGENASHEICPSCDIEFGFNDVKEACGIKGTREQLQHKWRENWIAKGMPWSSKGIVEPPVDWDPQAQIKNLLRTGNIQ